MLVFKLLVVLQLIGSFGIELVGGSGENFGDFVFRSVFQCNTHLLGVTAWRYGRSPPGINRITGGPRYWRASGEILRPRQERHQRKQWAIVLSLIKDERYGIEED